MSYIITERMEKILIQTCSKCGKKFTFYDTDTKERIASALSNHTKQCTCHHSWTDWHTTNLRTWPDYEPYTTRECTKCGKGESI